MTNKEIRDLIERRRKDWRYGNSVEAKYKAEECDDILELIDSLQEEPVSKELEDVSMEWLRPQLDKSYSSYGETKMMELTRFDGYAMLDAIEFGANWQKEQEYTCYEEAFEDGASWKKEEMMANAIDVTVHIDAGGYPYIPQIELYDYDKDVPLAKEGDKYKVVLIKENKDE